MYLSPLTSKVYLLVNRFFVVVFSEIYITFILQWIAFIFGRDLDPIYIIIIIIIRSEVGMKRSSRRMACKRDNSHFLRYLLIFLEV